MSTSETLGMFLTLLVLSVICTLIYAAIQTFAEWLADRMRR